MVSRAVGKSEAKQRVRGRSNAGGGGESGGNSPQHRIRAAPAWAAAVTGACVLSAVGTVTVR
jgi:hypothetical protein